jgi:hypothetical protein
LIKNLPKARLHHVRSIVKNLKNTARSTEVSFMHHIIFPTSIETLRIPLFALLSSVPPIFLAAFAMQESTCRPDVVGDQGGAFGLMQITKDKCGGAPGGNCVSNDGSEF